MHRLALLLITVATAVAGDGDRTADPTGAATGGGGSAAGGGASGFNPQIIIIVGVVAFMYFILIRPQRKEEKRRKEMMSALKRGDRVVTIGGLHGEIVAVGETTIDVKAGEAGREVVLTFNKGAVQAPAAATVAVDAKGT